MIDDLGSTRQCSKDPRQRKVGERDENADAIVLKADAVLHCSETSRWANYRHSSITFSTAEPDMEYSWIGRRGNLGVRLFQTNHVVCSHRAMEPLQGQGAQQLQLNELLDLRRYFL